MANPVPPVFRHGFRTQLPEELVDSLDQAYFLHLLATEPERVIPPGKTLLSMMIHSQINAEKTKDSQADNLLERVQEVAHRAFWGEATEALSSSVPSTQLLRLKRLYRDLADALSQLFPRGHKVLQALEAQLPPTSSPLHSALHFLEEILLALRERCAPIRDPAIDSLYARLDQWRDPNVANGKAEASAGASSSPLAALIVNTLREIVVLADQMKSDLNAAVIGAMEEDEIEAFVQREAKAKEREVVLKLWDMNRPTPQEDLREVWHSWAESLSRTKEEQFNVPLEKKWIVRLMEQLATNQAVECDLPPLVDARGIPKSQADRTPNRLPLHFLFVVSKLVYIQNYLQAITIAASLRSLTHISVANSNGHDFMSRVWALLKGEIDDDSNGRTNDLGSIKVINLSDEVIRARRSSFPAETSAPEIESRLRAAVDRTLMPNDPVFVLLHSRLIDALTTLLLEPPPGHNIRNRNGSLPRSMRTGRLGVLSQPGERPKSNFPDHPVNPPTKDHIRADGATAPATVKGFEEPILIDAVRDVFEKLTGCLAWLESVWGGLV